MSHQFDPESTQASHSPTPLADLCPQDEVWSAVARGALPEEAALTHLRHASRCTPCSELLANAAAMLDHDPTPEEEDLLRQLETTSSSGRLALAARLSEAGTAQPQKVFTLPRRPRSFFWSIFALAGVVAVCIVSFFLVQRYGAQSDARLLVAAYDKHRISEVRLPGTSDVPLASPTRGTSPDDSSPSELLQVEVDNQRAYEKNPNDARLRQRMGETDLLLRHPDEALEQFGMAETLDPQLPRLKFDTATAYFLSAEVHEQPLDYARAIDLYSQHLQQVNQQDPVALFDLGLCWEREHVTIEAIKSFEASLALEKDPAWRTEIERHLARLKAMTALDPTPEQLAARLAPAHFLTLTSELPGDYELYLDAALRNWLPQRNTPETFQALQKLAAWGSNHHDRWLSEMLRSPLTPAERVAEATLARAIQASAAGDNDGALAASTLAARQFHDAGNRAGLLRAQAERIYALQRSDNGKTCLAETHDLQSSLSRTQAAWLALYVRLESAACLAQLGELDAGIEDANLAIAAADENRLPAAGLRAHGFKADSLFLQRHLEAAWAEETSSLGQCQQLQALHARAFQQLFEMKSLAEALHLHWTQAELAEAAVVPAERTGNLETAAYAFEQLGMDQARVGDAEASQRSVENAERMLTRLPPGPMIDHYRADWRIDRALAHASGRLDVNAEIASLQQLEPAVQQSDAFYPRLDFYTELAALQRQGHQLQRSLASAWNAVNSSEHLLSDVHSDLERQAWQERAGRSYKILVLDLLELGRPADALAALEWFRAAPYRENAAHPVSRPGLRVEFTPPALPADRPAERLILVIAQLEDHYVAWSLQGSAPSSVQARVLAESPDRIAAEAGAFSRLCADPHSSSQDLQQLGESLYSHLLGPFDDQLNKAKVVELHLDPSLAHLPFAALSHSNRFLGLTHALVLLDDGWSLPNRHAESAWTNQEQLPDHAHVLVLQAPAGQTATPIPEAYDESVGVTQRFPGSSLESTVISRSAFALRLAGSPALADRLHQADLIHYTGHGLNEDWSESEPSATGTSIVSLGAAKALRCRLAVLAACHTFGKREDSSFDVPSFARILLRAGAGHVLASYWDVDSRGTHQLMTRFYSELAAHQPFPEALRRAQVELASQPGSSHPYYWASFQLVSL